MGIEKGKGGGGKRCCNGTLHRGLRFGETLVTASDRLLPSSPLRLLPLRHTPAGAGESSPPA